MNTNQNTQAMRAYEALADDELILNLGSQSWATRHYSYMTLQARGQAMLDAALRGLRHTNPVIRRYAADLMDHLGNDVCVPPLLELLNDPVPKVRRQAVHSLSCQRCKATPLSADMTDILIDKMLNDPNQRVRGEAAFGLWVGRHQERQPIHLARGQTGNHLTDGGSVCPAQVKATDSVTGGPSGADVIDAGVLHRPTGDGSRVWPRHVGADARIGTQLETAVGHKTRRWLRRNIGRGRDCQIQFQP